MNGVFTNYTDATGIKPYWLVPPVIELDYSILERLDQNVSDLEWPEPTTAAAPSPPATSPTAAAATSSAAAATTTTITCPAAAAAAAATASTAAATTTTTSSAAAAPSTAVDTRGQPAKIDWAARYQASLAIGAERAAAFEEEVTKGLTCPKCGKVCKDYKQLKNHRNSHIRVTCPFCDKYDQEPSALPAMYRHLATAHPGKDVKAEMAEIRRKRKEEVGEEGDAWKTANRRVRRG